MNELANALGATVSSLQVNVVFTLYLLAVLLLIQLANFLVGYRLNVLGIYPRNVFGLVGIVCSPFLHGNFNHLFFNAIPLFILANLVLLEGMQQFYCVSVVIIVLSGFAVWVLGRKALHVGASSVIMGYWGYLLVGAFQQGTLMAIILAIICIYYLGGLFLALLPGKRGVSWEGHVLGCLAGISAVYLCS